MHHLKKRLIPAIYLLTQFIFFILIAFIRLPDIVIRSLMISAIAFNAIAAIVLRKNEIFIAGLLSTIGADVCLSYLLPRQFNVGITFFLITQIIYSIYFYCFDKNKKRQFIILAFRIFLMILLPIIAFVVLKDNQGYANMTYAITFAMLYLPNLVCNLITAFLLKNKLMGIGFILFFLCDLFIGLTIIATSILILPASHPFLNFLNFLNWAWLFYIPSQVLIILGENNKNYFLDDIFTCKEK